MKLLQQLIIDNEERLLRECSDKEIANTLRKMVDDDRKNQGILETVLLQYGIHKDAKSTVQEMVEKTHQLMQSNELSFFEKIFQHELLKHQQVMNGITIHKAAQKVGADVMAAIGSLNTINFENRAHQEQLKGSLEILGVRELTGQDADQGIWARVQDAIAAISGAVGSAVTQTSDKQDMNIQDVLRMDHNQINILFTELIQTNDLQKIQEYFRQIDKDLIAHAGAEQEVVYPRVRSFYGEANTQQLYDEQSRWGLWFDELRAINPTTPQFKDRLKQIWDQISDYLRQEESTLFPAIRNNMTTRETEDLATQFKAAKSRIQERMRERTKTEATV